MDKQRQHSPPLWINYLFTLAVLLACTTALGIAILGWKHRPYHHTGLVADITVNLNGRPVREHCTTCHPGGSPANTTKKNQADRPHPDITPHSLEKLGCTGCHLGEGMAMDVTISHGLPGLGARQTLKGNDLQASCYKCHELKRLEGAEESWQGYELFLENACGTCHHVAGLGQGGRYGPDLSAVGSYLGLEKIYEAIRDPKKEPENSIMPRFSLSHRQARNISYFLKSRVEDPYYTTPMLVQAGKFPLPPGTMIQAMEFPYSGERLLESKKCLGCHKFRGKDGRISPDLTFIGSMRSRQYLWNFILNPAKVIPGAIMPQIPMSAEEEETLVAFFSAEATGSLERSDPKHLYMELCQRCHAAAGDGFGLIQPNLANFPRAFANNADFFRRISDGRIMKSIEMGIPGTSMPAYGKLLNDSERERLIDLIFSAFIDTGRDDKVSLSPLPDKPHHSLEIETVESLFRRECTRCHGIAGTGTGPEYLVHLPRPRNLTNTPYFEAMNDNRIARAIFDGIPGTAMPSYRKDLTSVELWALVDKVRRLSRSTNARTEIHEPKGMAP